MGHRWTTFCGRRHAIVFCGAAVWLLLATRGAQAQIKSFPQAEGAGALANGGRGGDVYHVTNLIDSGVGSLRYGIENAPSTGRTIVFDVGGWIDITSKLGVDTNIRNLTIAGQTAPGGIGVRGRQFSVGGDDVIVRHMRFRPGKSAGTDNDSVNTNDNAQRVIYDHISAEFSTDGGFDAQATDVTLQFSSVSYGLETHSTGSLLENPHRLTMHHNLYAHNNTRNPKHRVQETLDWVNNVIYNWDARAIELQGTSDPAYQWTANIDGNYFIAGPNQGSTKPLSGGSTQNYETWWGTNAYDADGDSVHDGQDYSFGDRAFADVTSALTRWKTTPFTVADEVWKDANTQAAYERVLSEFGATPWARDEVDGVLRNSAVNRNGNIVSHENQLVALGVTNGGFGTLGGVAAPLDTDGDGMPDTWELKHGLSPTVATNNGDFDNDGYTNLEEYLNDLAAFKATGPLEFDGTGRYADWSNWTRRWEPSRVDDIHVNGEAIVDAVGQHAGTIHIGTTAGASGTLSIESGWLEVTDEIVIGADPAAADVLNLSGGVLAAPALSKGVGGTFNFTGGTLQVDEVNFSLVNNGGTIAPGHSPGTMHVAGDLTLNGGLLVIEVGGTAADEYDRLEVDGVTTLGGSLNIVAVDLGGGAYVPQLGDQIPFLASQGGTAGEFDMVSFPAIGAGLKWAILPGDVTNFLAVVSAVDLAGDYNDDGTVDAADYTVWRDSLDSNTPLVNETASLGVVDQEDYDAWKANFGAVGGGSGSAGGSVPEPAGWLTALFGVLGAAVRLRRTCPAE